MGNFSWHCGDCDLPILSEGPTPDDWCFKCEDQFTDKDGAVQRAHLLNVNGTVNTVEKYDGYGVFGGVDAYAWLARNNVEGIREWDRACNVLGEGDSEYEPTGNDDDDRGIGISMTHDKREKTFKEIQEMLSMSQRPLGVDYSAYDLYHHAKDFIKNPIKIICDTCYKKQVKYSMDYEDYHTSRSHDNQGWTESHETDVGWVCSECYNG